MKRYVFTESQVKRVIDQLINEQYSGMDDPEDMHHIQGALNAYFKARNIKGVWDEPSKSFTMNPKAPVIAISDDGAWGDKSKAALSIFQQKNGLKDDGLVGCCSTSKLIKLGYLKHDLWGRFLSIFGWEQSCSSNC